jgi:hypothetical protein
VGAAGGAGGRPGVNLCKGTSGVAQESDDVETRSALSRFVMDSGDLERLEDVLSQFNIFEAIGAVRQELRHSDFLSWLLNPTSNHGLGDLFLKRLLQRTVLAGPDSELPFNPVEVDVWSFSDAEVRREWENIDILLLSERNRVVVVIENKVLVGEGKGQLTRYRRKVADEFHGYRKLFLFLSVDGDDPSDDSYLPVSYSVVCDLLTDIIARRGNSLAKDVVISIDHYVQMLRRHYVSDSELASLARKIYQKHRQALDYIFEQKPDLQMDLRQGIETFLKEAGGIDLDDSRKSLIRFAPRDWDGIPALREGQGNTSTKRMLLVGIKNDVGKVRIALVLGPGPDATRQSVFQAFRSAQEIRTKATRLYSKWTTLWARTLLTYHSDDVGSADELTPRLKAELQKFINDELPKMRKVVSRVFSG